jgi:hypothetical protein
VDHPPRREAISGDMQRDLRRAAAFLDAVGCRSSMGTMCISRDPIQPVHQRLPGQTQPVAVQRPGSMIMPTGAVATRR